MARGAPVDDAPAVEVRERTQQLCHDALSTLLTPTLTRVTPPAQHLIKDVACLKVLKDEHPAADVRRAEEAHDVSMALPGLQRVYLAPRSGLSVWSVDLNGFAGSPTAVLVLCLVDSGEAAHSQQAAQTPLSLSTV